MRYIRGGALAETALFVSAALLFMLGTIQIGVLGAVQMTADAAAYYDARLNVLTVGSNTPEYWTNQQFPQIPQPDISPTVIPAATPTIPVDYGYNDPSTAVQQQSPYQRHGGASMLQPASESVTVNNPAVTSILGQGLGVNAVAAESEWQECGTHFDIANAPCSLASPPSNSQTNYFTEGENTPPYMVGFSYMEQCNLLQPWGVYTGTNPGTGDNGNKYGYYNGNQYGLYIGPALNTTTSSSGWNTQSPCAPSGGATSGGDIGFIAEGSAEFLHAANWSGTGPTSNSNGAGISGPCDTTAQSGNGSFAGEQATDQTVFCAIWWHQRVYADLAQYFAQYPYQYFPELYSQVYDNNGYTYKFNMNNQFALWTSGCDLGITACPAGTSLFAFGNLYTGGLGNGTDYTKVAIPEAITSFEDWEGFDDPNYGPGVDNAGTGMPDRWNNDVHIIYSWDIALSAGQPPSDPTYNNPTAPLNGCCTL